MKVPEKSCFGHFGPFWVKNTLHVVTKWCFRPISSNILMLYGQVLLYEHYFMFINVKMNLKFSDIDIFTRFGPFFGKKWSFLAKNQRFDQFLKILS